jgi:hypothetical protein
MKYIKCNDFFILTVTFRACLCETKVENNNRKIFSFGLYMTKQGNLLLTHAHSHSPWVYFSTLKLYVKRVTLRKNLLLTYLFTHSTQQSHSWQARNSSNYKQPDSSLPRLQVPATWAYPNPDQFSQTLLITGARGGVMVKALRYKPAGRGFGFRWCHWNFSVT